MRRCNSEQYAMLLEEIRKCPQQGKAPPLSQRSRRRWEEKWHIIRSKLNSLGPPRSTGEWIRILCVLKSRTRKVERALDEESICLVKPLTPMEKEVAHILGWSEHPFTDPRGSFETVSTQKPPHEQAINSGVLEEFQFVDTPPPTTSKTPLISPSSSTMAALSNAVFKAVSAAASAATNTLASTSSMANIPAFNSTATDDSDDSSKKRHKNNNAECLELLRKQVACQQTVLKSLNRIANAIELLLDDSDHTEEVEEPLSDISAFLK